MGIKSENIVATAVTLLTASERSVAAVTDAYRARLEDYLASMLQAKRMLSLGIITPEDYAIIDTMQSEEFGLLVSSIWGSTKRYLTWNEKDTPQKRLYYRLVASARGMNAQERLSWVLMFPTPLASDTGKDAKYLNVYLSENGVFRKVNPNGTKWSLPLSAAVYYLTPMASDGYRSTLRPESMMKSKANANLATQMIHLEKPQNHDAALNPDWVEWLMGFPRGWTAV